MSWESQGRYYTRTRRRNGRVVRIYIGGGIRGEEAAAEDVRRRTVRSAQVAVVKAAQEAWGAAQEPVVELTRWTDMLLRAALTTAGFYQHDRGASLEQVRAMLQEYLAIAAYWRRGWL